MVEANEASEIGHEDECVDMCAKRVRGDGLNDSGQLAAHAHRFVGVRFPIPEGTRVKVFGYVHSECQSECQKLITSTTAIMIYLQILRQESEVQRVINVFDVVLAVYGVSGARKQSRTNVVLADASSLQSIREDLWRIRALRHTYEGILAIQRRNRAEVNLASGGVD